MIDLLICCLVLLPFLIEDIELRSGDREAQASEELLGLSICHVTTRTGIQRRAYFCRFCHIQHLVDRYRKSIFACFVNGQAKISLSLSIHIYVLYSMHITSNINVRSQTN